MSHSDDKNAFLYLLAGFGLGALLGAAAGLLFAPKPGSAIREDLGGKVKDLKHKTEDWIAEQKAKRQAQVADVVEGVSELGA